MFVYVDSERIKVEEKDKVVREFVMRKFVGLNERTCQNPEADHQRWARR